MQPQRNINTMSIVHLKFLFIVVSSLQHTSTKVLVHMNAITYILYRLSGTRRANVQTPLTSISNLVAQ